LPVFRYDSNAMYTDLWLAIKKDSELERKHPVLGALLYAFCPAAARWWRAGAEPKPPFDPVWTALEDIASGATLKDSLHRLGFEKLVTHAKDYIEKINGYRKLHPGHISPELWPQFPGGRLPADTRFGSNEAIESLGNNWDNFFIYIRVWSHIVRDWELNMRISDKDLLPQMDWMATSLPDFKKPFLFPVWAWTTEKRTTLGIIMNNGLGVDVLRGELARYAGSSGSKPWSDVPALYMLDSVTGIIETPSQAVPNKTDLSLLLKNLYQLVDREIAPPQNALMNPKICAQCAYRTMCYMPKSKQLTPLAQKFTSLQGE